MQEVPDELIERYFKGLCSAEEAAAVLAFLKKHPEHPYLLQEWENTDGHTPLAAQHSLEMYDAVAAYIKKQDHNKGRLHFLWRIAAAACILAVFVSLWLNSVRTTARNNIATTGQATTPRWQERQNTRDTNVHVLLPDGSAVVLSPGAYIKYPQAWAANGRREVHLKGEAFFQVAKNKDLPFVVYSGFIRTTALGTAFKVANPADGQHLQVRLLEGKVRVDVIDSISKKMPRTYYLLPGQELLFNSVLQPALLRAFKKPAVPADKRFNNSMASTAAEATYMFNNQMLSEVLDHLSAIYHVPIIYARDEIGQMYFIGKIETTDPIEKTIQDIALLNKLSVKKRGGGYILKRKKQ